MQSKISDRLIIKSHNANIFSQKYYSIQKNLYFVEVKNKHVIQGRYDQLFSRGLGVMFLFSLEKVKYRKVTLC